MIFLHRRHSFQPFLRVLKHTHHDLFSLLQPRPATGPEPVQVLELPVTPWVRHVFQAAQVQFQAALQDHRLLLVEYTTVQDYLWLFRFFSGVLGRFGPSGMGYYAAAVSDYYIPSPMMPRHKLSTRNLPRLHRSPAVELVSEASESVVLPPELPGTSDKPYSASEGDAASDSDSTSTLGSLADTASHGTTPSPGPAAFSRLLSALPGQARVPYQAMLARVTGKPALILRLFHVPKMLWHAAVVWPGPSSQIFSVSFKLETNQSVLHKHARISIQRYSLSLTIANLLQEHRRRVTLYGFYESLVQVLPIGSPDADAEAAPGPADAGKGADTFTQTIVALPPNPEDSIPSPQTLYTRTFTGPPKLLATPAARSSDRGGLHENKIEAAFIPVVVAMHREQIRRWQASQSQRRLGGSRPGSPPHPLHSPFPAPP